MLIASAIWLPDWLPISTACRPSRRGSAAGVGQCRKVTAQAVFMIMHYHKIYGSQWIPQSHVGRFTRLVEANVPSAGAALYCESHGKARMQVWLSGWAVGRKKNWHEKLANAREGTPAISRWGRERGGRSRALGRGGVSTRWTAFCKHVRLMNGSRGPPNSESHRQRHLSLKARTLLRRPCNISLHALHNLILSYFTLLFTFNYR